MPTTSETTSPKFYYRDMRSRAEEIADRRLKKRVLKGLEALKTKHGDDWANHITPSRLRMREGSRCVLGQVYGDYRDGLLALGLENGEEYGFNAEEERGITYENLDQAWQHVFAG